MTTDPKYTPAFKLEIANTSTFVIARRIHSAVGGMSPNQAEQLFLKQA